MPFDSPGASLYIISSFFFHSPLSSRMRLFPLPYRIWECLCSTKDKLVI